MDAIAHWVALMGAGAALAWGLARLGTGGGVPPGAADPFQMPSTSARRATWTCDLPPEEVLRLLRGGLHALGAHRADDASGEVWHLGSPTRARITGPWALPARLLPVLVRWRCVPDLAGTRVELLLEVGLEVPLLLAPARARLHRRYAHAFGRVEVALRGATSQAPQEVASRTATKSI